MFPERTKGISVKARNAVMAAMAITKPFLALALQRPIRGTKTLETSGRIQTSQAETSETALGFSLIVLRFIFLFFSFYRLHDLADVACAILLRNDN